MNAETVKNYSESKKLLTFTRKVLLNWVYNTKKEKGIPSSPERKAGWCHGEFPQVYEAEREEGLILSEEALGGQLIAHLQSLYPCEFRSHADFSCYKRP